MLETQEPWRWIQPQPETVVVADGVVTVNQGYWDFYNPLALSNLPNALAHVETEKDAAAFVQRFGLLGYSGLADNPMGPYEGDPVGWMRAHARAVNFALKLIEATGDTAKATGLLQEFSATVPLADLYDGAPAGSEAVGHIWPVGIEKRFIPFSLNETWRENFHHLIPQILAHVVDGNTQGVRPGLSYSGETLTLQFQANALIEIIWYKVGEMAVSRAELRTCEECGTLFVVTDRRQRFCPKDTLPGQRGGSVCCERNRKRRQREAAKPGKKGAKK